MGLFDRPVMKRIADRARMAKIRAGNALREAGVPLRPAARVVYHPEYTCHFGEADSWHVFDVWRSERIVEQLERAKILGPSQILTPEPVAWDDLLRVHTPGYLEDITSPQRLAELLLVSGRQEPWGDDLLRPILLQVGGTILAVERAVEERLPVFNLGGGFHHAQCDRGEGFCAVNDVAIAIRRAQERKLVRRVLIVDLDYHHGNGNALIFSQDESVYTLSIHGQSWATIDQKQNHLDLELPPGTRDDAYITVVRHALRQALESFNPDVAIYIAGADPHREDSLGDFALSEDGLLERDLLVLGMMDRREIPLAVTLGGGYGSMAWTIPYNFICSTLTGKPIQPINRPSNIRARLLRVRSNLPDLELKLESDFDLTEDDISDLVQHTRGSGSGRFMNFYSREGLEIALERYGFFDLLREQGLDDLQLSIDTRDPDRQICRIHFERKDQAHLLVELIVRFVTLASTSENVETGASERYRVLCIEWLLMQDPRASFSLKRPKLPGQEHPGLGLGRWMVELLRLMAERLDCQGLMNHPQHYHNGILYSKQMLYFDPEDQGYMEALKRDLGHLPLVDTSIAIDEGRLRDADTGAALSWSGEPQVMPVDSALNRYFTRPAYVSAVASARGRYHFRLEEA